jgi:VIT1/CCC1 family predicted Fe2+/Mn2+ transporter
MTPKASGGNWPACTALGASQRKTRAPWLGAVAALALGAAIGVFSGLNVVNTVLRQLAVAALAAAVTYGVGHLLGVSTS